MLIRGLWESQMYVIVEVRFGYSDAKYYLKEGMDTLFTRWEHMKKDKQGWNYHKQRIFLSVCPIS